MNVPNPITVGVKEIKPKLDHNISLAGLLVTDANTVIKKLEREQEGILKGLFAFKKKIPTGEVYICNGAEFPNAEAVDLLLYLLWYAEKNGWQRTIEIESLNRLSMEVFGVRLGKTEKRLIERSLTIWKFHGYYFPDSFTWRGAKITAQFGVIDDWKIERQGRGKPSRVRITFNEEFLEICKHTDWYRRPSWLEIRKLRKEIAKRLYMLALEYKPGERSREWKIYIDADLKHWYRNAMNSLANPEHLYPKLIIEKRLKPAVEEITAKTNLRMELQQTEEGNYCIAVREKSCRIEVCRKQEIPFDALPKLLKEAVIRLIERKKHIKDPYALARSLSEKELETYTKKLETATVSKEVYELLADLEKAYGGKLGILSSQESGGKVQIAFERENSTLKKWLDVVRREEEVEV